MDTQIYSLFISTSPAAETYDPSEYTRAHTFDLYRHSESNISICNFTNSLAVTDKMAPSKTSKPISEQVSLFDIFFGSGRTIRKPRGPPGVQFIFF